MEIDLNSMPSYDMDYLCAATLKMARKVFSLPGEQEKYEAWLKEYRKRHICEAGGKEI